MFVVSSSCRTGCRVDPFIITVATTGAMHRREEVLVPYTPREVADEVVRACDAGAAIAHIHVRDAQGRPSLDPTLLGETVERIRARCDVVICLSNTSPWDPDEVRLAVCDLEPELVTVIPGTIALEELELPNSPAFLKAVGQRLRERRIHAEIEAVGPAHLYYAQRLVERGILAGPLHVQFALGYPGGMPATARSVLTMLDCLPPGSSWGMICHGPEHWRMVGLAVAMGGHARVGMEDHPFIRPGTLAGGNAELVARAVRLARELDREPASPAQARRLLGLSPR